MDVESRKEWMGSDLSGVSVDMQIFCDPVDIQRNDVLYLDDGGDGATTEYFVVGAAKFPVTNPKAMQVLVRKYQGRVA